MDMMSGFGAPGGMAIPGGGGAGPGTEWVAATPPEFMQLGQQGMPFPAQKEQLQFDPNVHVSYQKFRMQQGLVVAFSVFNRTGAPINVNVTVDPPGCCQAQSNTVMVGAVAPGTAGAAVVQMQVTSHDFGFSCVAKVDYGTGFINVSAPLSMADFLRPVQGMAVQQFGAAWQQPGMVERKAQLPASSCRSAEAFMAKCTEFGVHPIQAIGTEAVAVGQVVGTGAQLLMHGKTSPQALEVLLRSADRQLSEAINAAVRQDAAFK